MTRFKNETKDRELLIMALNKQLCDTDRELRRNAVKINDMAKTQRGLKELKHVLMSARGHFLKQEAKQ